METIKRFWAHKIFRIFCWAFLVLFILYAVLVVVRVVHFFNLDKTNAQVEKIHNTKLTMDDVLGKNLPPNPGALADKTVAGVDANQNGIRDDVELAVFQAYPDLAKTRAVLLQYALALQMETIQPFLNEAVAGEVAIKGDRAISCLAKIVPEGGGVILALEKYGKFISDKQINTEQRKANHKNFYSFVKGGKIDDSESCDIDIVKLQN
jgi:hypothetical protein